VRTVQAIIDSTGAAEFETCRTLFDFLNRNLIAAVGRGSSRAVELEAPVAAGSAVPGFAVAVVVGLLALVGVVVQLGSPFAVTGLPGTLRHSYETLQHGSTRSRLARLEHALAAWRAANGSLPRSLEDLAGAGLVDRRGLVDAHGRPFRYEPRGRGYLLAAEGAAGQP
jgi:hypothetical protein